MAKARKSLAAQSLLAPGQNILRPRVKNMRDVLRGVFGDESATPMQRLKRLNLQLLLVGIAHLHEIVSIFKLYMLDFSRPVRFTLVYVRIIFMMAIQALFTQNLTMLQNILLGIILGQACNIVLRSLKTCLVSNVVYKLVGFVFTLGVIGASWFILLVNVAKMEKAQVWALALELRRPTSGPSSS